MYKCKLKSNSFLSHPRIGRVKVEKLTQEQMKILYDNKCQYIEFQEKKKEPDEQDAQEPRKTKSPSK